MKGKAKPLSPQKSFIEYCFQHIRDSPRVRVNVTALFFFVIPRMSLDKIDEKMQNIERFNKQDFLEWLPLFIGDWIRESEEFDGVSTELETMSKIY